MPIIAPGGKAFGGPTGFPAGNGLPGPFKGFPVGMPAGMSGGFGALDIFILFCDGQEDTNECLKNCAPAGVFQTLK
jgi:hypothetical protein